MLELDLNKLSREDLMKKLLEMNDRMQIAPASVRAQMAALMTAYQVELAGRPVKDSTSKS